MKNYTYGWMLRRQGYVEVPEFKYNEYQNEMKIFIEKLSDVVVAAKCGWDGVRYAVMKYEDEISSFMVLYCGGSARWVPITGNSKGCNLQVLGENIW